MIREGPPSFTSRRPPFNQQPPFDLEDLVAELFLAELLFIILLDEQIRAVGLQRIGGADVLHTDELESHDTGGISIG